MYQRALEKWGDKKQLNKAQEECGEFVAAVNHLRLKRITPEQFLEEVADVEILMSQMILMFPSHDYPSIKNRKLGKLDRHLNS